MSGRPTSGVTIDQLVLADHHGDEANDHAHHDHAHHDEELWGVENVELLCVGIDIGSSTSHLMLSRVHLQRLAQTLSSRFEVVDREVIWRSPVLLTPYLNDGNIDADALQAFVDRSFAETGYARADVDGGAVILTGEALKRRNARAIAELFASEAGRFVCVSAGHHYEAALAANGSGAVRLSRVTGRVVLHVDIGGGTTKLALLRDGRIVSTAAVAIGGRLVAYEDDVVVRSEPVVGPVADAAGVDVSLGARITAKGRDALAARLARVLVDVVTGRADDLADLLHVTEPLALGGTVPDVVTFSGGVAEYLDDHEHRFFGDLGSALARHLLVAIRDGAIPYPVEQVPHRLRATVIGASQFSVQVSGNTIGMSGERILPIRDVPVAGPIPVEVDVVDAGHVERAVRAARSTFVIDDQDTLTAVALSWSGPPSYPRLRAVAEGILAGSDLPSDASPPLIVLTDGDIARTLAAIIRDELGHAGPIVALDGLSLREFDHVDIGEIIEPALVVPVVIKSLLFASSERELVPTRGGTDV